MDMKSNGSNTILNWALVVAVIGVSLGAVQYFFFALFPVTREKEARERKDKN